MNTWTHAFTIGQFVLDFAVVSGLLLLGTLCRRYIRWFQRFLIPSNLIAGFLGLMLGPELLGVAVFSPERMGIYVYHLLALTFIGVGLQSGDGKHSRGAIHLGFIQIMSMLIQAMLGLAVVLLLVYLVNPDLVPAVGVLLPLGFGMGPGIAYSIGQSWEAYGFAEGASIGLTIAAIGFLVAYGSGILIVNRGIRRGHAALVDRTGSLSEDVRTGILRAERAEARPVAARMTFTPGSIEPLTFHVALVAAVYLVTYGLTLALAEGLVQVGMAREVPTLWSFQFILANLIALATGRLMHRGRIGHVLDEGFLHRLTGLLADYLIAASILAISLTVAWDYIVPIAVMCAGAAFATYASIKWVSQRVFDDYPFERFAGIYGEMTGTISSGLALIRIVDPEYKTPVAQDLVLSSGLALGFGFPLLLAINMPFTVYDGALEGYWTLLGIIVGYLVLIVVAWSRFGLQRKKRMAF